jgi:hypothetical protein
MFCHAASEMALVHNMMIRAFNSIYLQAPHITAKDEMAFCNYIHHCFRLLTVHHTGEEVDFFPHIEALSGEKGIMEANVHQHEAFHDGVDAFNAYVQAVIDKKEKYDGAKVVAMLDAFAEPLTQHLTDEIPTIEGLRKHADKLGSLQELMDKEGEKNMKALGLTTGLTACFLNLDLHFEDDAWIAWPPAPAPVKFIVRYLTYWLHSDWWKFAACDRLGNMRPLYAVPENQTGQ